MNDLLNRIKEAIIDGDTDLIESLAQEVIDTGMDPAEAIQTGGVPGLKELGRTIR